jgi:Flp pilus assembly protein TadG
VLVWFALTFLGLIGFIGIAVDVGRMYIVRNEAQSFADAAALAAAAELNGTTTGIAAATAAANSNWGKYHFGSLSFPAPDVKYSTVSTGGWTAAPNPAANYRFAQVIVTVNNLPMYLMPILTGQQNGTVAARAVAGQAAMNGTSGTFPFSPQAHCGSAADCTAKGIAWGDGYGLTIGQKYALRWSSKTDSDTATSFCPGDQDPPFANYVLSGKLFPQTGALGPSGADLRAEELDGLPQNLNIGDDLSNLIANGDKTGPTDQGMTDRLALDPNKAAYATYADYLAGYYSSGGNGERVVIVPISQFPTAGSGTVLSFGAFLLEPSYPKAGKSYWCAMYLGSAVEWTNHPGASTTGLFELRLVQ